VGDAKAVAAAKAWIETLKSKDLNKVSANSGLPFAYKTTDKKKTCDGVADDASKRTALIECVLAREKLMIDELTEADEMKFKAIAVRQIPAELKRIVSAPGSNERLVTSYLNGDGVTFTFVFLIGASGGKAVTRAVFVDTEFHSG
jgi:hypothetical protein